MKTSRADLRSDDRGSATAWAVLAVIVVVIIAGAAIYISSMGGGGGTEPSEPEEEETAILTLNTNQQIQTIEVPVGRIIPEPEVEVSSEYIFGGWYADSSFTLRFNFNIPIYGDIVLYGKFIQKSDPGQEAVEHTIKFVSDGSQVDPQAVEHGKTTYEPASTKEGYVFGGWYTDPGYSVQFNFMNKIYVDMTLYAKFIQEDVNVSVAFHSEGTAVPPVTVLRGGTVSEPSTYKEGSTFAGWYTDPNYYFLFNFSSRLYEDTLLYAKFTGSQTTEYLVEFYVDGNVVDSIRVGKDSYIGSVDEPVKEGNTFSGWYTTTTAREDTMFLLEQMTVKSNLKLHACFDSDDGSQYLSDLSITGEATLKVKDIMSDPTQAVLVWQIATVYNVPVSTATNSNIYYGNDDEREITMEWTTMSTSSYTDYISDILSMTNESHWSITNQNSAGLDGIKVGVKGVEVGIDGGYRWTYTNMTGGSTTTHSVQQSATTIHNEISEKYRESMKETVYMKKGLNYRYNWVAEYCEVYEVHTLDKLTGEETMSYALLFSNEFVHKLYYTDSSFSVSDGIPDLKDYGIKNPFSPLTSKERLVDKGDGSLVKPFLIVDANDLKAINNNMGSHYRLVRDIILTGNWTSIGDTGSGQYKTFSGIFDGGGKRISDLSINITPHYHVDNFAWVGLFAIIGLEGKVANLTLDNVSVEGKMNVNRMHVGAVAGLCKENATIENCLVLGGKVIGYDVDSGYNDANGTDQGSHAIAGGIVGKLENSKIISCRNAALVQAEGHSAYSGGMVGHAVGTSQVSDSVSQAGSVKAIGNDYSHAGGIVGWSDDYLSVMGCTVTTPYIYSQCRNFTFFGLLDAIHIDDAGGICGNNSKAEVSDSAYLDGSVLAPGGVVVKKGTATSMDVLRGRIM